MRECFEIVVQGLRLRGVVHRPDPQTTQSLGFEGLGVLLLHPGFLPRSAQGDTAVALGDALAQLGIAAIRIDMPGLGDSEGSLPADSFTFIDMVQEGGLAGVANDCVDRICELLNLRQILIGGLCGAAITGFYAVALQKQNRIAGVIALDPIFYLVRPAAAPTSGGSETAEAPDWAMRRELFTSELRLALLNSRLGGPLQKTAQKLRTLIKRSSGKAAHAEPTPPQNRASQTAAPPPPQTNIKLLECVEHLLGTDLPVLFVTAEDPRVPVEFDYLDYLLSRQPGCATLQRIIGTDHGFISGNGKARLIECVSGWIQQEFGQPRAVAATAE